MSKRKKGKKHREHASGKGDVKRDVGKDWDERYAAIDWVKKGKK